MVNKQKVLNIVINFSKNIEEFIRGTAKFEHIFGMLIAVTVNCVIQSKLTKNSIFFFGEHTLRLFFKQVNKSNVVEMEKHHSSYNYSIIQGVSSFFVLSLPSLQVSVSSSSYTKGLK